jgi:hypothetical protein
MTLPEYYRLCRYWQGHPPVHLMVAGYLGIKPAPSPAAMGGDGWDIAALVRMAPGGYLRADQLARI